MFELDTSQTFVGTRAEEVVDIYASINRSTVAPPGQTPEPAQAYIATVHQSGAYQVYIYLYLSSSNAGLLYKWRGGAVPPEQVADLYQSAFQFSESMGFMLDDLRYRDKSAEEKAQTFAEVPMFHQDLSYLKTEEPAAEEGAEEGAEELVIESLEEGQAEVAVAEEAEELNLDVLTESEEPAAPAPPAGDQGEAVEEVMLGGGSPEDTALDSLELQSEPAPAAVSAEPSGVEVTEVPLNVEMDEQTIEGPVPSSAVVPPESAAMTEEVPLTPEEAKVLGMEESPVVTELAAPSGGPEIEEITLDDSGAPAEALTPPAPVAPEPAEAPAPEPAPILAEAPAADEVSASADEPAVESAEAPAEPAAEPAAMTVDSAPLNPGESGNEDYQMLVMFLAMM